MFLRSATVVRLAIVLFPSLSTMAKAVRVPPQGSFVYYFVFIFNVILSIFKVIFTKMAVLQSPNTKQLSSQLRPFV